MQLYFLQKQAAWISVGNDPDIAECLRSALRQFGGDPSLPSGELRQELQMHLQNKRVLLILDDVWTTEHAQ